MSQQPPGPDDPQATQPVAPGSSYSLPPPPPPPTERIPLPRDHRPPPSLWALLGLLVAAGILIGFVFGHFVGRPARSGVDPNLILFESASSTIPFPGAQFTASTYDAQRGTCDKTKLKQFLRADQRRFNAWLRLVGINASQFDAFVDRLETARLTSLSPVTNHGCSASQCPFSFQSVLAAGTPVWRDPVAGHIVAKCACSNPLSAPQCPPNCNAGGGGGSGAATAAPTTQPEQTLPPATSTPAPSTPPPTLAPAVTPNPVPTVTPF
jgi:hypothetical protein